MITFHLMRISDSFHPSQLEPGSSMWPVLWSWSHGPVYSQEPAVTLDGLRRWRTRVLDDPNNFTPIFLRMMANQTVFNRSGMQEATDQLLLALIHPLMPTIHVCSNDEVWARFLQAIIDYDKSRIDLALPTSRLPYVSGPSPFYMNVDGHERYLNKILCYWRNLVIMSAERLQVAHELGLFLPQAVIQPNGHAEVPVNIPPASPSVKTTLRADHQQASIKIPNLAIIIARGKKGVTTFTPFTARAGTDWFKATSVNITGKWLDPTSERRNSRNRPPPKARPRAINCTCESASTGI
ncbi:hypothetical protein B0H10DRAFT_2192502 [Mycena sp. CBHHK59/15]|nr:hypothetical protein B0H10DRAFT_2192502 [Mycena sp. CBHHK59/15]